MADHGVRLSDLAMDPAKEHPLENIIPDGKCMIHVKFTDFCAKSVESLIHSDKGAFFSLWFGDHGGTMAIPVSDGAPRKFQFKIANLQGREVQSSLECVHHSVNESIQPKLGCWGPILHRITVQGTEKVFESTRTKMKEAEKQRKEPRARKIELPSSKVQSKTKKILQASQSTATTKKASRLNQPKPQPQNTPRNPKLSSNPVGRMSHSLRERVMYILALKPIKRGELIARLKKDTKRGDSLNVDSILAEVAEVSLGNYKLKLQFLENLQVDSWPFYSDAERLAVKRKLTQLQSVGVSSMSDSAPPVKRSITTTDDEVPTKKARHSVPTPPLGNSDSVQGDTMTVVDSHLPSTQKSSLEGPTAESDGVAHKKKKNKKKKKKEKLMEQPVVLSDPSSTSDTPDYTSQYPPITSHQQRSEYKQQFNSQYVEYIEVKGRIDRVSTVYQKECAALSNQLTSLDRHSERSKEIKQQIRANYSELQKNKQYIEDKKRFEELHHKLDHIKRMVIQYDSQHIPS